MKIIKVLNFIDELTNDFNLPLLYERYTTINTLLNIAANKFIKKFIETAKQRVPAEEPVENKKPETDYYYLAKYISEEGENIQKDENVIFQDDVRVGKYTLKFSVALTKNNSERNGTLREEKGSGKTSGYIFINPTDVRSINTAIRMNKPSIGVKDLMFKKKSTLVHEMSHYIQKCTGQIDNETVDRIKEVETKYENLKPFMKFLKSTQKHEIDATLNQAYKLYYERTNQGNDDRKRGSFWRYVAYVVLYCDTGKDIGRRILSGGANLNYNHAQLGLYFEHFLLLWILYYYIPNFSKFKHILFKDDKPVLGDKVSLDIVIKNKNNIDKFLQTVKSFEELENLNAAISNRGMKSLDISLFSVERSNKALLMALTDGLDKDQYN